MLNQKAVKYAFILGHVPELSKQEIIRVLAFRNIEFQEIFSSQEVFLIEAAQELDVKELQERLGGTVKIARIVYPVSYSDLEKAVEEIITSTIQATGYRLQATRFQFGFSLYGKGDVKEFKAIGLSIKRKISAKGGSASGGKETGISCRFVVSKEKSLSSVIVKKERLLEQGMDVVVIEHQDQYYLGQTVAVQDYHDYSVRDYGRPNRDDKSGMLPPKLAKIMINLAAVSQSGVIFDPFCGSGTILQEALLMGMKSIIGSDISEKAVSDSQNNLNWLKTKYKLDISGVKIFQADARNLTDKIKAEPIDAIVTEPYLGEAQNSKIKTQNFSELSQLYLQSLAEFYKILKTDGRMVMILPIINGQKMEILDNITSIGFKIEPLSNSQRQSIIYGREGARVEREIFVLRK